jgi:hypothetical protein
MPLSRGFSTVFNSRADERFHLEAAVRANFFGGPPLQKGMPFAPYILDVLSKEQIELCSNSPSPVQDNDAKYASA